MCFGVFERLMPATGAGLTGETRRTDAAVAARQLDARAVVQAGRRGAHVRVYLTVFAWKTIRKKK